MEHQLPLPTEKLVRAYIRTFEDTPGYYVTDRALFKLFGLFPRNASLDEILLKATTLNSLYATNIFAIYTCAEHIYTCNIDEKLDNFDMNVDKLYVAEVYAHQGPTMKRWRAGAQGRASVILKRSSHVGVTLKER